MLLSKTIYITFRLYIFFVSMCSLGIERTTFALLTQCSTTEPQEQCLLVCTPCTQSSWCWGAICACPTTRSYLALDILVYNGFCQLGRYRIEVARAVGADSQMGSALTYNVIALQASRVRIPVRGPFPILPSSLSPTSLPVCSPLSIIINIKHQK